MRISVDRERCQGHSMCIVLAPDVYSVTDEGYNEQGDFDVAPGQEDRARRGAGACPERAITLAG
ncbi:ferredoxin [Kitasatospora sp. NPDC056184]|uniref:ferredoxin n=1 Tax=Kitasatospora sp. NPDC056184 TaxID=3345738 RepID=UPI0035DC9E41